MTAEPLPVSFVDTNVLVYALAADDTKRSPVAQTLVRELMAAKAFQTSTQVLQELYVTLTRKIRTPITPEQALRYLDQIAVWPVAVLDYAAMRDAVELSTSAVLSFWDALILVAAARSGAKRLYTEDLQDGQIILGIEIVNPFGGKPRMKS
jgi:predicted nucleic acid-binding protein